MNPTCWTCQFFRQEKWSHWSVSLNVLGECCIKPPQAKHGFPKVMARDFCGEHQTASSVILALRKIDDERALRYYEKVLAERTKQIKG